MKKIIIMAMCLCALNVSKVNADVTSYNGTYTSSSLQFIKSYNIRVISFNSTDANDLSDKINSWLSKNNVRIVSIQYSSCKSNNITTFSALITYHI